MNANKNVGAVFTLKSTITISASATAGGTITPSGSTSVNYGVKPDIHDYPAIRVYRVWFVLIDNKYYNARTSYTFTNVTGEAYDKGLLHPSVMWN